MSLLEKKMKRQLTVASMFAGIGGIDLGFEQFGLRTYCKRNCRKDYCYFAGWRYVNGRQKQSGRLEARQVNGS